MKKFTLEQKARYEAVHFYMKPSHIAGYVEDWIEGDEEVPDVDQDIKDLAKLLTKFHKECNKEKL